MCVGVNYGQSEEEVMELRAGAGEKSLVRVSLELAGREGYQVAQEGGDEACKLKL